MQHSIQAAFDELCRLYVYVWEWTIHQGINLLKDKNNDEGRTTKTTGRLVNTTPKKTIRELDFNIPVMTRDIIH